MKRKVFLLGLDGGSWNLLDRMFAAGVMPNLKRLCREGVRATLESTLPPITPVAWTSLMTGVNPGRHGVFGFKRISPENSYLSLPVNRMDMGTPTLFDYYREGGRLISLNLPMSYPATEINGLMVTGMMTPLRNPGDFEFPRGLLQRFAEAGISYEIDPKFDFGEDAQGSTKIMYSQWLEWGEEFVRKLSDISRNRMLATYHLLDQEEWELFICVIVGTDRIQHLYWDQLVPPDGSEPEPILAAYYAGLDEHIGELVGKLGPEDSLLIVSDHGFVKHHGHFLTNEWLRRNGWLAAREASRSPLYPLKKLLDRLGITRKKLNRVLGEKRTGKLQLQASHVDWKRSAAFLGTPFGIRINLKGRETLGLVEPERFESLRDEIMIRLGELVDENCKPLLARILRGEEWYDGEAPDRPDIVFQFRDDRNYAGFAGEIGEEDIFRAAPHKSGDHRLDGILVAYGGNIKNVAEELRFRIWDVLPTVMHLNGRAVPAVCDGRVLTEILVDPGQVKIDEDWRRFRGEKKEVQYDKDQEEEINERLRALGYISDN